MFSAICIGISNSILDNLPQVMKIQPILNAAIVVDVDIIISGDKHFLMLDMERPRTMTAVQYLERIVSEE